MPINFYMTEEDTSMIDKIATACLALCTCSEFVVPYERLMCHVHVF